MIRILLTSGNKSYGFDITNWESKSSDLYDNLLTEDLIERVGEGDVLMYVDSNESAEYWCEDNGYDYELVEPDDSN
jgi:hypothetical protein